MSTNAQSNSILESLERLRPDPHSCLMIYEGPKDQATAVTCAPGEFIDQKQIEENDRQVQKYVDVALYNRKHIPPHMLLNLIHSHRVVIWDGLVCENLDYGLVEERMGPDPTAEEVERVLANLRDRQRIKDESSEPCRDAAALPVESPVSEAPGDSFRAAGAHRPAPKIHSNR